MIISLFANYRLRVFIIQHQRTATRLSGKLCNHEATNSERIKMEHLIFIHLNAARRATKLFYKFKRKRKIKAKS